MQGALQYGTRLFIWDAFHQIPVTSLPTWYPPYAVACRMRFEETAPGSHKLRARARQRAFVSLDD